MSESLDIQINLRVDETDAPDHPLLDDAELAQMLDNTRAQVERRVRSKLSRVVIPPEHRPLQIIVSGVYALETEQMDLSYHIATEDRQLLLQVVTALNR